MRVRNRPCKLPLQSVRKPPADVENLLQSMKDSTLPRAKQASKRKRRTKAVPVLGSRVVLITNGVHIRSGGRAADMPMTRNSAVESRNVSLAMFYVVLDKESVATPQLGEQ